MAFKFHKSLLLGIVLMCAVPVIADGTTGQSTEKTMPDWGLLAAYVISGSMALTHTAVAVKYQDPLSLMAAAGEGIVAVICFYRLN
jgi:hypothetical protein